MARCSSRGCTTATTRPSSWAAYEGVRAESLSSPFASVPTALMRQGNFSEISAAVRNPFTGQPFPGNIIPSSMISPVALKLLELLPCAESHRNEQQRPGARFQQGQRRSVPRPRRSEHRQQDPLVGPLQLARQREHQHRRDSGDRDYPAAREQEHAVLLHPHVERRSC